LKVTVLIPTHDHGPLLGLSTKSALVQTHTELEVLIVGDGVDATTQRVAEELASGDERVRFLGFPKGERHGEAHRHAALAEATGDIVCYLADDDLWFPDHVEYVTGLLEDADFAHSYALWGMPDRSTEVRWFNRLPHPEYRERLLHGRGAHTGSAYHRTVGWAPTPEPDSVTTSMWRRFAADDSVRMVSGTRPTVLYLPSPHRRGQSGQQRLAEMEHWWGRVQDPEWVAVLRECEEEMLLREASLVATRRLGQLVQTLDALADSRDSLARARSEIEALAAARRAARAAVQQAERARVEAEAETATEVARLAERADALGAARRRARRRIDDLKRQAAAAEEARRAIERRLEHIESSKWWRLRQRLTRLPLIGRLLRSAGGARSRREGR
jgi:GalNAc5-diNAcBac-PP-undecaprenol beta-1,3-glucosyltransferase